MTPNIPLLRRVREQIENHPETWDQSTWFSECGSTACVAGWSALLAGGKRMDGGPFFEAEPDDIEDDVSSPWWNGYRPTVHVENRARRVLGVDWDTADYLFDGENTIEDVRRIMDEIEAGSSVTA